MSLDIYKKKYSNDLWNLRVNLLKQTQAEFSLNVGISQQSYSYWEKGKGLPNVYNHFLIEKYAKTKGCNFRI